MANLNFRAPWNRSSNSEEEDLGFGTLLTGKGQRLINRDGSFNIDRRGWFAITPYQSLVEMSWGSFFLLVVLFYLLANAIFAFLFLACGVEHFPGIEPGSSWSNFLNLFFFSVQTFTTVGYGATHPLGNAANVVASFDALVGLLSFALMTGLFFARFSKPRAEILFSDHALIAPYRGGWSFQFRIANKRNNQIIDLTARVMMTWIEEVAGEPHRRFAGLPLERKEVYLFPLNWTIVHPIDKESPLAGKTAQDLQTLDAEFLILIEGYDETFAQQVHTNSSYSWRDLRWHEKFERMYYQAPSGQTVLELDKIDASHSWEEE